MDEHDQMIMMALTSITTSGLLPLRLNLIWQIGGIILTMPKFLHMILIHGKHADKALLKEKQN